MENQKIFRRVRAIKQGKLSLAPPYQALVDWLAQQLNAPVIDFYFNRMNLHDGRKQQYITIVFERTKHAKAADTQQNKDAVTAKFKAFLQTKEAYTGMKDVSKNDFFETGTVPAPSYHPTFISLEEHELQLAIEKVKEEIYVTQKYKDLIWKINNYTNYERVIFYYTDAQKDQGYESGSTGVLMKELFALLKKYDEFNYFEDNPFNVRIDTKETFDRDFDGQEYIYFR